MIEDDGGVPLLKCAACMTLLEFDDERRAFVCPDCGLVELA